MTVFRDRGRAGASEEQLLAQTLGAIRAMAAVFADPVLAPADAGADGVAVRAPEGGHGRYVLALTTAQGCPVEVDVQRDDLLGPGAEGIAYQVYEALAREAGAHLAERETLIVTTRGRAGPGRILQAYRRRLLG